jgi:endonuclease/exonuclease/phosphatase family metal-dependent hydrolase
MGCVDSVTIFSDAGENPYRADSFSAMTFNVRHRNEQDPKRDKYTWEQRKGEILATIRSQDPDILAVQELNDRSWIGPTPEHDSVQTLLLDGLRGEYNAYLNSADSTLFTNDCITESVDTLRNRTPKAIFFRRSKFRCLSSGSVSLPGELHEGGYRIKRYASWVILQQLVWGTPTNHKYFVLNTHLAAGDNEPIRVESVRQLTPYVLDNARYAGLHLPIVFAGDLNSKPTSAPLEIITNGLNLVDSYSGVDKTVNAWGSRTSRLDYILHSPDFVAVDARVIDYVGIAASDHYPFKATLAPKD